MTPLDITALVSLYAVATIATLAVVIAYRIIEDL